MNKTFPVTHSILSANSLSAELLPAYELDREAECKLINRGLNDTYWVKTQSEKYILRAYRSGWRSQSDILFELDVLLHLKQKGIPVSYPVPRKDGQLVQSVLAPEGVRMIVLFSYAPGKEPNHETPEENQDYLYGKSAAQIHAASDDLQSQHPRFALDLDYLLSKPLHSIEPLLSHRPADWAYLQTLAERLRQDVLKLPPEKLERGFCHGDFHGGNVHVTPDGTYTFFDFDCCGMGWRAYDMAVYRWGTNWDGNTKARWEHFLRGYQEVRQVTELDLQAVNSFVAIRQFWLMGLHTSNGQDWGFGWMNDTYFDHSLRFFRRWETEQTDDSKCAIKTME